MPATRKRSHFGPEPHVGIGPETVHYQFHEYTVGKTIAQVYLGDSEPFKSLQPENSPPDGIFRSEYLAIEFTDGTMTMLEVGPGNSFFVLGDEMAKKQLAKYRKP